MLSQSIVVCTLGIAVFPGPLPTAAPVAGERSWKKVMYFGGAVGMRGRSLTWDNTLVVSPSRIRLELKNRLLFEIDTTQVTALTYTADVRGNTTAIGTAVLAAGLLGALFASGAKSTDHYLVIEYLLPDGVHGGVLLRAHKDNFAEILEALRATTSLGNMPDTIKDPERR